MASCVIFLSCARVTFSEDASLDEDALLKDDASLNDESSFFLMRIFRYRGIVPGISDRVLYPLEEFSLGFRGSLLHSIEASLSCLVVDY